MNANIENILLLIAPNHLGVDMLDTRNSDRLDFHEVSAWKVKKALQAAFMAGTEVGCWRRLKIDHLAGIETPSAT